MLSNYRRAAGFGSSQLELMEESLGGGGGGTGEGVCVCVCVGGGGGALVHIDPPPPPGGSDDWGSHFSLLRLKTAVHTMKLSPQNRFGEPPSQSIVRLRALRALN